MPEAHAIETGGTDQSISSGSLPHGLISAIAARIALFFSLGDRAHDNKAHLRAAAPFWQHTAELDGPRVQRGNGRGMG